jgi:hypothetical protein
LGGVADGCLVKLAVFAFEHPGTDKRGNGEQRPVVKVSGKQLYARRVVRFAICKLKTLRGYSERELRQILH